jgi:hypothetical protein
MAQEWLAKVPHDEDFGSSTFRLEPSYTLETYRSRIRGYKSWLKP